MGYLDELNPSQAEAVRHADGPAMIIAGPGSGKTRVLTYRIAYLMERGIDPFNILALTFTNKAAREMRQRIEKIVGTEARNLWMGTFHSVFARVLRIEADKLGYTSNFTIYDTQDSRSVIKNIVSGMGLNEKIYKPGYVHYRISAAKNALISPAQYLQDAELMSADASASMPRTAEIYAAYNKRCFQSGAMDFDDLLFNMHILLSRFPDILYKYQKKFRYILIDEYQDTNYAQYLITKQLADMFQNICVVGDDAQSIYSFRGASIRNILNFEKDYPDLRVFKLEQNYRSTRHIVEVANTVIVNNKLQLPKKIWTVNGEGERIRVIRALSDNDEGRIVADSIHEMRMRYHFKNDDFAILYRTNAQSRPFEEALRRLNIPYKIYGGLSFYQRKEIKDLLAYLKLTVNHHDEEALRRIINYPLRQIGKTTLEKATVIASEQSLTLWQVLQRAGDFNIGKASKIQEFITLIRSFATLLDKKNAYDLALHIARSTGILNELYHDQTPEGVSRYENLQELLNSIREFTGQDEMADDSQPESDKSLGAYLQQVTLLTDQDEDKNASDTVKLMTIHSAKGLEFECVYIGGLEENLFPNAMSLHTREDLEEERRLFYVAVTRAKSRLTLTYARSRYRHGNLVYPEPSRFIDELPADRVEHAGSKHDDPSGFYPDRISPLAGEKAVMPGFTALQKPAFTKAAHTPSENFKPDNPALLQTGMDVEHQRFGIGKVVSLEGKEDNRIATIFFPGIGQKRIMLKFAKIMILNKDGLQLRI